MKIQNANNEFFTVPQLEKIPFLIHGFGTGKWKEKDFKKKPEWKDFTLLSLYQIHSNVFHFIDKIPQDNLKGDALVTTLSHLLLIIKTADCLPVLFVAESPKIIAAVHCGWKGTQKRVLQLTVKGMEEYYGLKPSSLLVAFGPCIGSDCYEVGKDVWKSFKEENLPLEVFKPHPYFKDKYLFDLRKANLFQILSAGVKRENIFIIDYCSHCYKILPSFRRDGKKATRMLSFIGLLF